MNEIMYGQVCLDEVDKINTIFKRWDSISIVEFLKAALAKKEAVKVNKAMDLQIENRQKWLLQ